MTTDSHRLISPTPRRRLPILWAVAALLLFGVAGTRADVLVRYVKTSDNGGSASHSGTSWEQALDNLQEAMNALHNQMQAGDEGIVYVAQGRYNPTESTESRNSNILHTSFLMYEGITVYGGYHGDEEGDDLLPENRVKTGDENAWDFRYETILSGNHSSLETEFTFNPTRGQYTTRFPSSSYHVVWFGTNGELPSASSPGHRNPFRNPGGIDGCIIEEGNAASRDLEGHNHMGYGGGAYLVENTFLRNCHVRRCQATLRGGGVYLDGGGSVENCLVESCQTTGVAIAQGYGGAVCIDYNGVVKYSYLTQSTARIGGGLAICHSPGEYPTAAEQGLAEALSPYQPFAVATIVSNNTSNAEGGGIYLDEGGTLNHCTVVKNNCIGPDITYYGRRHGRSGGVYVRNCGMLYNSVLWSNRCQANSDIQFASIVQSGATTSGIEVYHSALYNQDITDWGSVTKDEVYTLEWHNDPAHAGVGLCTWFESNSNIGSLSDDLLAGVDFDQSTLVPREPQPVYTWRPRHTSSLAQKGIQVSQSFQASAPWILHAHSETDIYGKPYEMVSTLGAVSHAEAAYTHALLLPQSREGRDGVEGAADVLPTVFVDPNRDNKNIDPTAAFGASWTQPMQFLSDAVNYLEQHRITSGEDKNKYLFDGVTYPAVQILIKEGRLTTAGIGNYLAGDLRTASIRPKSNMRFYGGYPSGLTGQDVADEGKGLRRNPRDYTTLVTANITGNYENNSTHVFSLVNVQNVIIDGLRLYHGNTIGVSDATAVPHGAALIVSNKNALPQDRIPMTGNQLRNCVVANSQAMDGAAFYVNGEYPDEDGDIVPAELTILNTMIRNCTGKTDELTGERPGVVVAHGNAHIDLDHCTVVNNVGYPLKTSKNANENPYKVYEGTINVTNSAFFANSLELVDEREDIVTFTATMGTSGQITGHHNMFDATAVQDATLAEETTNQWLLSIDSSSPNYPVFKNPSRNVGHSEGGDRPLYGGTVNYEPLNANPLVNAADEESMQKTDRSDYYKFDRGGAADIGAIEDTSLPENGAVLYVTEQGAGRMDGSCWAHAIAGNLVYRVGDGLVVDTENADKEGIYADGQHITTRNKLYRGGFAIDYVYRKGSTTYRDKVTTTRKNIYQTVGADGTITTDNETTGASETKVSEVTVAPKTATDSLLTRVQSKFIYGEKSGASRNFYRTNMSDVGIPLYYQDSTANQGYKYVTSTNIYANHAIIINNRDEDYVSGLQFAVEQATRLNADREKADRVQVWVGHGTYEDYKGFVIRDKVEVFGGFPTTKIATPGMSERHALVSQYVPLSNLNASLEDEKDQYETILQVIDKTPYKDKEGGGWEIDKDVLLFRDVDYAETGDKTITTESEVTVPVYYRRNGLSGEYSEVRGDNVVMDMTSRLTNPSFEQCGGTSGWGNNDKSKLGWTMSRSGFQLIQSDYSTVRGAKITNVNGGFEFYQDVFGLEPGYYRVSCKGYNKDNAKGVICLFANGEEQLLMDVADEDASLLNKNNRNQDYINLLAQGKYNDNWVDVYVGASGHLRLGLKGNYPKNNGSTSFDDFRLERLSGVEVGSSETSSVEIEGETQRTMTKVHSTLRKHVLFMPDVCMSTYSPGKINGGDGTSNTQRQVDRNNGDFTPKVGSNYVQYEDTHWDGFTIRNGFLLDYYANRDGGAGVRMYEGCTLENCVVTDNFNTVAIRSRGAGAYADGKTSKVIGCFFINNIIDGINTYRQTNGNLIDGDTMGGGICMFVGTCYNSLFANNIAWGNDSRGAGTYIEDAIYYNNTIAYNSCFLRDVTKIQTGKGTGVHQYNGENAPNLNIFNTIFYKNTGLAISAENNGTNLKDMHNCYIQSDTRMATWVTKWIMDDCILDNAGYDNKEKQLKTNERITNPFEFGDEAKTQNNFRLLGSSLCVNRGIIPDDQKATFPLTDVDFAARVQDCRIDIGAYEYNGAVDIAPDTVTFRDRKLAIFYVTQNGFEAGNASAKSPDNAACAAKLQKVLDAAGRWVYARHSGGQSGYPASYDLTPVVALGGNQKDQSGQLGTFAYTPERSTRTDGHEEDNVLDYSLIIPHGVQLWGGFYEGSGSTPGFYRCEDGDGNVVSEPFESDGSGGMKLKSGVEAKMLRDVLRYPTYLNGSVTSITGATGQAFHVVHFTNDLFDANEVKITNAMKQGGQLEALSALPKDYAEQTAADQAAAKAAVEERRAVLDGLIITGGYANGSPSSDGSMTTDQNGAAAIVTGYAHVRNCVVTDNQASGYGGGLYLEPHALVSGTVVKNCQAQRGGGIYVEQPENDAVDATTFAYIFTSTIVANSATERGGGLYFESNLRANSSAFWHNSAMDKNNVSGWYVQSTGESSAVSSTNYPLVYCGVENNRWEGVNNLQLSANETEGVRWDHLNYYELYHGALEGQSLFYPIEMSSVLARAGMTYDTYNRFRLQFPTLELTDMAGLQRMENGQEETIVYPDGTIVRRKKNNSLIDMGARVMNGTFEISVDPKHIMRRLYVVHTQDLESDKARLLQDNAYTDAAAAASLSEDEQNRVKMYSQMGSCFLNPFHRLGDAFQYIIEVRKSTEPVTIDGVSTTLSEYYRNQRFEIFVTKGTFYPYTNAYGDQAASRSNTFVIPEKVTLMGGVDCTQPYGQDGWGETGTDDATVSVPVLAKSSIENIELVSMKTQTIRDRREKSDLNMNNVVEPWELARQTILSGNVVSGTETQNAYHVITCYPDEEKVGLLPTMYRDANCTKTTDIRTNESRESRAQRTIFVDGLTVTGGLANDLSDDDKNDKYQQLTYFRGGGILVDGNWDSVFPETDKTLLDVLGVSKRDIPLTVTNSLFQDNMAGNGGAIYSNGSLKVIGCHFVQNSSRGPNSDLDQQYIPWTAGGAIATNYDLDVVNTIFANNEAMRGTKHITLPNVEMADIRQGFGGVISSSETSTVHALNCDFVRNKAVAFPAIYNFLDQQQKRETDAGGNLLWEHGDHAHWAVNCIFWGNENDEDVWKMNPQGSVENDAKQRVLQDLFTVAAGKTPRKPDDAANFGIDDRKEEVLYFCAYEQDHGLESQLIVQNDEHKNDHKKAPVDSWDYYEQGTFVTDAPAAWKEGGKTYTHNQYLDHTNDTQNGPNFIQPSTQAGISGYMQNADWLVSRLNRLIDNGWSYLPQHVTVSQTEVAGEQIDVFNTVFAHTDETVTTVDGSTTVTTPDPMDNTTLKGSGIYNFYSLNTDKVYSSMGMADLVPLGEHPYMKYDRYGESSGMNTAMRRISTYPKLGEQEVFVDIGVYEYQYVQLFIPGNAYDVIWVRPDSPGDGTVADGSTWARATNNIQQAIDMLMSSHNDHDKVLKVRAGTYSPVYLTHGKLAFYIERTKNKENILYPTGMSVEKEYGVGSITIRGGYPNDDAAGIPDSGEGHDGESQRDIELNPTRFVMSEQSGYKDRPDVIENLFVVEHMEQQKASKSFISDDLLMMGTVVPVSFEGLTLSNPYAARERNASDNKDGAAILYTEQTPTVADVGTGWKSSVETNLENGLLGRPGRDKANGIEGDGRPKLLIKDCIFLNNSTDIVGEREASPAVHIMKGSGEAVVVNSLFHSNGGNPIDAEDTRVVNCSFALNNGHVSLSGDASSIDNSLIWRDGLDTKTNEPFTFSSRSILGHNNAFSDFSFTPVGDTDADAQANQTLSEKNSDVLHGPNFTQPLENVIGADPWLRDMHPRPSDRVMSRASKEQYKLRVPYYVDVPTAVKRTALINGQTRTTDIQTVTRQIVTKDDDKDWDTEKDLAAMTRFRGKGLERGPYETVAAVQRVLYVNPSNLTSTRSDGASWTRAFGEGHLQDAVDAAGVYSGTNGGQRAYVFVKGDGLTLEPTIQVRDGVTVFGSLTNTIDSVPLKEIIDGDYTFKETEIYNYMNRVRASRTGIATTNAASLLQGVMADGDNKIANGFVMDGFHIVNPGETLSESPVVLHDGKTLLRNTVIRDNVMQDGAGPIVDIKDGLLYNTLVYGNNAPTAVSVGSGALGGVLNCTVVAGREGQTAISSATANKVVNTVTYNMAAGSLSRTGTAISSNEKTGMFAPYLHDGANVYNYPFGDEQALWYQLHEKSECIDGGTSSWSDYLATYNGLWEGLTGNETDGWVSGYASKKAQRFIDFGQDRDVLGNPRLIGTLPDRGAFETWSVAAGRNVLMTTETDDAQSPVENYGGHRYPHAGSVVYAGAGASLIAKPGNFNSPQNAITPGYLLLGQGASIYGQGNHVRVPYVAVEKQFVASQQYALFALPYDWRVANVVSVVSAAAGDDESLQQTLRGGVITSIKAYDGATRAAWNYQLHDTDSPCWVETDEPLANEGYLLRLDGSQLPDDGVLRFTGWGVSDYGTADDAYTEEGTDKAVVLEQHDEMPGGGKAHFTTNENMGWNLKGLPWLVTDYPTYAIDADGNYDADSHHYQMTVPHLFYTMDGDGNYVEATPGSIYSRQSWANGSLLSPGSAFLTQTAIIGDEELLTFRTPLYHGAEPTYARPFVALGFALDTAEPVATDLLELHPADADQPLQQLSYSPGTDGTKFFAFDHTLPQLSALSSDEQAMSLVSQAPRDVEIALQLRYDGDRPLCLWLPDVQAYDDCDGVWLTDRLTGTVTNLKEQSYTLQSDASAALGTRLSLRLGVRPFSSNNGATRQLDVYTTSQTLHVTGLQQGETVSVFTLDGALHTREAAPGWHFSTRLYPGVYIVRIGSFARKIIVKP